MNDSVAVDYGPLQAERQAFRTVYRRHAFLNTVVFVVAVALCLTARLVTSWFLLTWIGFGLAVLRLIYLGAQVSAFKNAVWEQFAVVNGWPLNAELMPETLVPASLQFGRNQRCSPVISAQLPDVEADLFTYQTTVGSGKSQRTCYFSLARVLLPGTLPHIMLKAKKGIAADELQQDLADHETLQLEGDFNDYFTLQVEKGQEVGVLEILTPDVMQALIGYSQQEDIEITGDNLYFIVSGDSRTPEAVQKLIQSVTELSRQITEQIAQTTPSLSRVASATAT